jgi:hypothetical protein
LGTPLTFGKFTGQTASPSLKGRRFTAAIGELSGTSFTGTVQLRWRYPEEGVWRTCGTSDGTATSLTLNEQQATFDFLANVEARLECTSYTSGPIKYSLAAQVVSNLG